jgi:hypothetical protein
MTVNDGVTRCPFETAKEAKPDTGPQGAITQNIAPRDWPEGDVNERFD